MYSEVLRKIRPDMDANPRKKNVGMFALLTQLQDKSAMAKKNLKRKTPDNAEASSETNYPLKRITMKNPLERERITRYKLMALLTGWNREIGLLPSDPRLISAVITQSESDEPIPTKVLKSQFNLNRVMIHEYVRHIPEFQSLCVHDQELLWGQHGDMLNALILSKAMDPKLSLSTKIWWFLLCMEESQGQIQKSEELAHISKDLALRFEFFTNLSDEKKAQMEALIDKVNAYSISTHWLCFIVFASLFLTAPNSSCDCEQPDDRVNFMVPVLDIVNCLGWKRDTFLVFLENLKELSILFNQVNLIEKVDHPIIESYSHLEDLNVTALVMAAAKSMKNINMGQDMVQEIFMKQCDVPVSSALKYNSFVMWKKRFHLIMSDFEGFSGLNATMQEDLILQGFPQSFGLVGFWFHSLQQPLQQANFILGHEDQKSYDLLVKDHPTVKLICLKFQDLISHDDGLDTCQFNTLMDEGCKSLQIMLGDFETFILMLLFVLFQPAWKMDHPKFKNACSLSTWFEAILIRRAKIPSNQVMRHLQKIYQLARGVNAFLEARNYIISHAIDALLDLISIHLGASNEHELEFATQVGHGIGLELFDFGAGLEQDEKEKQVEEVLIHNVLGKVAQTIETLLDKVHGGNELLAVHRSIFPRAAKFRERGTSKLTMISSVSISEPTLTFWIRSMMTLATPVMFVSSIWV
eukprot:snap_masked-scaffold233_size243130-processed-gene-1.18 protein:Tk00493 transcript:snap_masked-scaffold233_size243130-processed-gene-1.18-mRNA-1 annotation:"dna-directed rna polymerase subunit f"